MSKPKPQDGLELENGRSVTVTGGDDGQVVEFRADGGEVELRVKMTADGPVVQLTGARVEINAAESIHMECKDFSVNASDTLAINSTGKMDIKSEDDCVIRGKMIYLN